MNLIALAPIPVYVVSLRKFTETELNKLESLEEDPIVTGGNNFISKSKNVLDLPELSDIKQLCVYHLNKYTESVLGIKQKFTITDSWATRNPKMSSHTAHSHPNSVFSGVYYVNCESGAFVLDFEPQFSKNFKFEYDISEHNFWNSRNWSITPSPGDLILFPSWVVHYAETNFNENDRRLLAFNTFPFAKFGSDNRVTNLDLTFIKK